MDLVLGQCRNYVVDAQTGIGGIFGLGKAGTQFTESFQGLLGGLLVAFGQVLLCDRGKNAEVIVEIDDALEVKRVIHGRTGWLQADKTVQRHNGIDRLSTVELRISLVELGLLGQRGAGSARFELVEEGDGLVPLAAIHAVLCVFVKRLGAHVGRLVRRCAAATERQHDAQQCAEINSR